MTRFIGVVVIKLLAAVAGRLYLVILAGGRFVRSF
jgi:hypothetical protein